jgi:predicted amidohydrolase YtcJ
VLRHGDGNTQMISLQGHTLIPGFVDTHSHIIFASQTKEEFLQLQQVALSSGITTTTEMSVTPELLERLQAYEYRSIIRLRYNTYLLYNTNCGEGFDPSWYRSHAARQDISGRVRNQGVKIFADGGSCNVPAVSFEYPGGYGQGDLYYTQEQMNAIIAQADADGYQVAVHALGDRAVEQAMNAIEAALKGRRNELRHRIEHNAVVRPEMAPRYGQIGILPTFSGRMPPACGDPNSHFITSCRRRLARWSGPVVRSGANPEIAACAGLPVFSMDPIKHAGS